MLVALAVGAIAGFLPFNFNPARVFMGDAGSLFIGFLLGTASLLEITHFSGVPALVFAPVAVLAIPIFDTFFVSVTRRLRGQPVSVGGTDHASHRLVRLGLNERKAILLLYMLAAGSGAVALTARHLFYPRAIALTAFWFLFLFLFCTHLFYSEVSKDPRFSPPEWRLLKKVLERETLALLLDPVVLSLAYFLAYFIRFRSNVPEHDIALFLSSWPIVLAAKFSCLYLCGIYRRSWWRGSVNDVYRLGLASIIGEATAVLILVGLYRFSGYSRVVFLVDCLLSWGSLFGVRKSFRLFREVVSTWSSPFSPQRRVFVLGTSERAELALRFLRWRRVECAGLIDTNGGADLGRYVWGTRVVGKLDELSQLATHYGVSEIVLPEDEPIPYSEVELSAACKRDQLCLSMLGLYAADAKGAPQSYRANPKGSSKGKANAAI
jgi:UDP-GlcNAc:undecaprenyl-phosphate GlcNAc-1-phosphate transferase